MIRAIMRFKENGNRGITLYNVGVETQTSVTRIADIVCEGMAYQEFPTTTPAGVEVGKAMSRSSNIIFKKYTMMDGGLNTRLTKP